jgi:peptide/nickel transport system permease protein
LRKDKKLWFALTGLGLIHLAVLGARFLAPYDPVEQHRDFPFAPPMRLHLVDAQGHFHFRPFAYALIYHPESSAAVPYEEDRNQVLPIRFFARATSGQGGINRNRQWRLFGVDAPHYLFLIGTDDFGRDQFSRLLYGGQVSLFAGLLAAALSLGLGVLLGSISGYYASWLDHLMMRGSEIFMALPWIYLLFAARAFLPLHLGARPSFFLLVGIMGLTGWARPSRLVRGVVLSAKHRDYVLAARGFGASHFYLLRRHILPETLGVVLTQAAVLIPQYILAEVTFSFLGLGVSEPAPSWGNMLANLQKYYVLESYGWMFAAGLALIPVFLLYHMLADALQGRTQPVNTGN